MKKFIGIIVTVLFATSAIAQTEVEKIAETPKKSALSYEMLTKFLQTNFRSGSSGGFEVKSTLFGIQSAFSKDSLNASKIYLAKKAERNLEFLLGLYKNGGDDLNFLVGGLKYAIINRRDKSEVNFTTFNNSELGRELDLMVDARFVADSIYRKEIRQNGSFSQTQKDSALKELKDAHERFKKSGNINEYPNRIQELYKDELKKNNRNPESFNDIQDIYDRIAKQIELRSLLTVSAYPGYDVGQDRFDSTTISLQYLKGLGKNYKRPWSIDFRASQVFLQDTNSTKDLSRSKFTAMLGINKVLLADSKSNPILEFEGAYEFNHVTSGLYKGEDREQPKLVSILRIHITKEISLPLTLKYDLKDPNLVGIFRFQWDFENNKKD